jgi:hypothetical protein
MNQPDDYEQIAKDGFIFSVLGSIAMLSRIILSQEKHNIGYIVRRMTAAGIVSAFVGLSLQDVIESATLRYAAVGLAGAAAPEIVDVALFWVRNKLKKTSPLK